MKKTWSILIVVLLLSCKSEEEIYVGNFKEAEYDFFESFSHQTDSNYYYNLPYDEKFGGISEESPGNYSWLRHPENLMMAFNSAQYIGLGNIISLTQYFLPNNSWCCDNQWDNLSPNDIVKGFLTSDTTSTSEPYYSEFWNRRREENNLTEVHYILTEIDEYYNEPKKIEAWDTRSELQTLLSFDIKLMNAEVKYNDVAKEYFDYLHSIRLDYSAYKLIIHNERITLSENEKKLLLKTLEHDTLSFEEWNHLNDNWNSWMDSKNYPDPNRNYGP